MAFYENFICTLPFNSKTVNVEQFPQDELNRLYSTTSNFAGPFELSDGIEPQENATFENCGYMPLYLYNYGTWNLLGQNQYQCEGAYEIDLENTQIVVTGETITAYCGFKRRFEPLPSSAADPEQAWFLEL